MTDALSQVKTYAYAKDDRLTGVTYTGPVNPTPNVSFIYDPYFPRLTAMTDGTGTRLYTYVPAGSPGALQLQQESGPLAASAMSHTGEAIGLGMPLGAHIDERNMRHLHLQVADIAGHITSAGLVISKCDRDGQAQPSKVSEAAVAEMLGATEELWGALLPYFFWVSRSYRERPLSLKEAVTEIEGASHPDEFLLVGYEDGAVLSISSSKLSFQIGARTAEWWRP